MQNASKKRKNIFIGKTNNYKKSEKSAVSNDEEVYYKLIDSEHPNALINSLIFNNHKKLLFNFKIDHK